ncbi:MAG TPA: diguanylate cyclase [Candidatus Baltobacteraceae bacterium]|jgi:diguanylate cyclase (GGDEF)-like protein/PAS domain S-box-containing protein
MERSFEPFLITAIENANDAVIVYDYAPGPIPFRIRYVNPMFERQTGYRVEEAIGQFPELMYGPKTDRAAVERVSQTLIAKLPVELETLRYRKDGTTFWAQINMRPLCDDDGNLLGVVAIQRDVTDRVRTNENLELLSAAMNQASDAMAVFERREGANQWVLAYVNEMFLRLVGYRREEVIGRASDFLAGPETNVETLIEWRRRLLDGEPVHGVLALYRANGTRFWAEASGRPIKQALASSVYSIVVYRDITEEYERERQLSYEASHDPLTSVHNRRSLERALEEALQETRAGGMTHGLIYFDLDGFKPINDRHGHEAGDRILVQLATAASAKLRRVDLLARIGGDEFVALLRGCPPSVAENIARDILEAIGGVTLLWNGQALRVGASIGVISVDCTVHSVAQALRRADEACYEAKRSGRNRIYVAS